MKISELLEKTDFALVSQLHDQEIEGAYVGDLLSFVMGKGGQGNAWVTIQAHKNILAVASLREFSCIIIADDVAINDTFIQDANEEGINVLKSKLPAYETCKVLIDLGI